MMNGGVAVKSETLAVTAVRPSSANAPVPSTAAPIATRNIVAAIPSERSASNVQLKDASYYRARGVASYHNGDVTSAIADLDMAIRLDSNFADAYIDRAVALYRMHQFDRAFADIAQARHIVKSRRTATALIKQRLGSSSQ